MVLHLTDRVSVESLTKHKPDDGHPPGYGELKSPLQLEDGSLRPVNGSVSAYSWENLGMLTHIAAVGTVYGTREPEATRGTMIGDVIVIHYVFMVVSSFMTGIGLNGEDYGGTFSWTMGFNAVMWVCAAASFLTIPFSWYCIQEVKNERAQMPILPFLYDVFQQEVIYRYSAFRFCFSVFSQITVTASSVIQSDWAKVEPLNSGIATYSLAASRCK
ncbi:hypothetical protein KRP22_001358 [Phytophthora ramorum]|nr:hypothetical protein KRP22_7233 [Phytophthora ramorum]